MFWVKFQNVVVSQDVYNTTEKVNYMTNACFKRVKTMKNLDNDFNCNILQKDKTSWYYVKQNIILKLCYKLVV